MSRNLAAPDDGFQEKSIHHPFIENLTCFESLTDFRENSAHGPGPAPQPRRRFDLTAAAAWARAK